MQIKENYERELKATMFIKDTNLLPRHSGVFFAIVILLGLLVLNFDKCYMTLTDTIIKWITPTPSINTTTNELRIEGFADNSKADNSKADNSKADNSKAANSKADNSKADNSKADNSKTDNSKADNSKADNSKADNSKADTPLKTIKKISVQVNPEKREATAKFERITAPPTYTIKNYLLVLAKYNKDLMQVDSLNVKMSNEASSATTTTGITTTTTAPAPGVSTTTTIPNNLGNSICNTEGICSYVFTDLDTKDDDGNVYYYKLGVGVIYDNAGVDKYSNITTYNFGTGNTQQYFRIDIDMQEQEKLLRRLADIESASLYTAKEQKPVSTDINNELASQGTDINAYMKMLRPYIGNYPDEFTLNKQKINELVLDSYLDENYAVGEFNVNVNLGNIMSAPTTTTTA